MAGKEVRGLFQALTGGGCGGLIGPTAIQKENEDMTNYLEQNRFFNKKIIFEMYNFYFKIYIYLRFLTSGKTADPATLFSHSSVPRVLCVCAGVGGRLFVVKSTVEGEATVPSRV